jgi:hypothetical protein
MRKLKVDTIEFKCKYCGRKLDIQGRAYLANPFCNECYEDRLEASGAIDLRDNHKMIDLGNGYVRIEPIDPNKKFKKTTPRNI